ncbi:hypothetical protein Ccrd_024648 [Cynara cardunculus var. scolymus]|uniref:Uncharacterized protein n=1 Tax=Cynara cardunculus var. scolymus TaxID=59895 RepID=A0A103XC28_CYNCS|nr:hypothetical protein Ccrd_024648 [Cynara cardunculus var. scolymus]
MGRQESPHIGPSIHGFSRQKRSNGIDKKAGSLFGALRNDQLRGFVIINGDFEQIFKVTTFRLYRFDPFQPPCEALITNHMDPILFVLEVNLQVKTSSVLFPDLGCITNSNSSGASCYWGDDANEHISRAA